MVRQPKCQWVRSYLQTCFQCSLSLRNAAQKTATKKSFFSSCELFEFGEKTVRLYSSLLRRTKWTCPLFFSLPPTFLFLSLALPRNGCHDNQAQSPWLTFFAFKHLFSYFNEPKLAHLLIFYILNVYCFDESFIFLCSFNFSIFLYICLFTSPHCFINQSQS